MSAQTSIPPNTSRTQWLSFWFLVTLLVLLLAASSVASPLYPLYQERFGVSSLSVTIIFALYALALLLALVITGRLSDRVGRRPLVVAALIVQVAGIIGFLVANEVTLIYVARILQGLGTGLGIAAITAWMLDLQPPRNPRLGSVASSAAPLTGIFVGAFSSAFLVQYGPDKLHLVYWILGAAYVLCLFPTLTIEDRVKRQGSWLASLRPQVAVPAQARSQFIALAPSLTATWALGGLNLSLGPALAISVLGSRNLLAGGLVVAAQAAGGSVASAYGALAPPRRLVRRGGLFLLAGVAITLVAVYTSSLALLYVGAVVIGLGFGQSFSGIIRTLAPMAPPEQRSGLISAIYIVSYLGFSLPAVAGGLAANSYGLHDATYGYGAAVMLLTVFTVVVLARRRD